MTSLARKCKSNAKLRAVQNDESNDELSDRERDPFHVSDGEEDEDYQPSAKKLRHHASGRATKTLKQTLNETRGRSNPKITMIYSPRKIIVN